MALEKGENILFVMLALCSHFLFKLNGETMKTEKLVVGNSWKSCRKVSPNVVNKILNPLGHLPCTWSWPSGWCMGLRSWLRGFDAQLGHLYNACTSLPQKSQAAIKWLEIRKKKKSSSSMAHGVIRVVGASGCETGFAGSMLS